MRRLILFLIVTVLTLAAGGGSDGVGAGGDPGATTTTIDPDQPVDSGDGDEPIVEPGPPGSVPEPRPPLEDGIDDAVLVTGTDLRIMESYPIQVILQVDGEKPTPCHEIFWSVDDDGEVIYIDMISQVAPEAICAQVVEPFSIAVPLGSWAGESREIRLNGEGVGSFDS